MIGTAIRDDIDGLRRVRNDTAHISEATLDDTEFQNYVGRVLNALSSLSLPISDIETVKNQKSFPTAEINNLKAKAANLQSELQQAKPDFQNADDENLSLSTDLEGARKKMRIQEDQVECLTQEINSKVEPFCHLTFTRKIVPRKGGVRRTMAKMRELEDGSGRAVSTVYI